MSHFVVAVVGDDHETQLEPFFEQGERDDYFMERVEEDIDFAEIRNSLKHAREETHREAVSYFTKHMTLPDGTVVDLSADEDTLMNQFAGLEQLTTDDGGTRYNNYRHCGNLPPLDADEATLVQWYEGDGAELVDGQWKRVYYSNPNAKWDWYQVGGRWSGFFKVKPSVNPDRYEVGQSGLMGSHKSTGPLVADQARKGDIDWEEMKREAEEEARKQYDQYEAVVAGLPPALTWDQVREKHKDDIATARTVYAEQPRVKALQKAQLIGFMSGEEDYLIGREKYVARAGNGAFTPYAVLYNGTWYERGEMGWFGMSSNEKDPDDWAAQVDNLFQSLDDDVTITIVDCHI